MRYLVLCVLAGLLAWPQKVAAETGEEASPNTALEVHARNPLPPQLMLRASYYLYLDADASDQTPNAQEPKSGQAAEEGVIEEPVSSPAPETEAPNIDTLSQRAIEHYEIQSEEKKKLERRRRRGLTIGVPIAVAVVVVAMMVGIAASQIEPL